MKFALVVCTYQRPKPLLHLLESVKTQSLYPNEIIIVDGSLDEATKDTLEATSYKGLSYFLVTPKDRGLTRQRNYGIEKVSEDVDIVCFLDDDTVVLPDYFERLMETYKIHPEALGVGGYIVNEVNWRKEIADYQPKSNEYAYDGYVRSDGSRFVLRKKLGLDADRPPAHMPDFAHGRSVSFLPPSGKVYPVEQFMGGVSSYRLEVLQDQKFSTYFEGYGLYEDADYTLRLSQKGDLYVNTAAQLYHYHDADGRPNKYAYGKMVIRNGWYVWRVGHPKPSFKAKVKWNATAGLLTIIRLTNVITGNNKKAAFTEAVGRISGWWSIIFNRPKHL